MLPDPFATARLACPPSLSSSPDSRTDVRASGIHGTGTARQTQTTMVANSPRRSSPPMPKPIAGGSTAGPINLLADVALGMAVDRQPERSDQPQPKPLRRPRPLLPSLASITVLGGGDNGRDRMDHHRSASHGQSQVSHPGQLPPPRQVSRHEAWLMSQPNQYWYGAGAGGGSGPPPGSSQRVYDYKPYARGPVGAVELLRPNNYHPHVADRPVLDVTVESKSTSASVSRSASNSPPVEDGSSASDGSADEYVPPGGKRLKKREDSESLNEVDEVKKKRIYVRRDVQRQKEQNAQAQKKFRWKKKVMAEQVGGLLTTLTPDEGRAGRPTGRERRAEGETWGLGDAPADKRGGGARQGGRAGEGEGGERDVTGPSRADGRACGGEREAQAAERGVQVSRVDIERMYVRCARFCASVLAAEI